MQALQLIAFHLPQFHPIPENDAWWGKGFTEWRNVVRGEPNFAGHYQPHLPADLGFYDLRLEQARAAQAELAARYGVTGFCFHYYWFDGKRLLEQPLEAMLAGGAPDFPFCLCWANENWTRRWNGDERNVLIAQSHSPEDDIAMMQDVARHFADHRYIRFNGRPVLLVYRIDILPDPAATVQRWREVCRELGVGDPYLCAVQSFGIGDPTVHGFDAAVEFPPHGMIAAEWPGKQMDAVDDFTGRIFSYPDAARFALEKPAVDYPRFRGVMPSWDNTARRLRYGHCYYGSHPLLYRAWLAEVIEQARQNDKLPVPAVFINAWNEWAEGCHLEPDLRYGSAWLDATKAAREQGPAPAPLLAAMLHGQQPDAALPADAAWADCRLHAAQQAVPAAGLAGSFYLRLRLWVNRHQRIKRALMPVARALRWVE
ncbi:Glycosyltransferase WbsX [Andreprevotia lacus DSM 23236]|jgi:lipopolysaccharide biosynthesis protein|uniref:Glycosyltransferase WbsX n=1 Tax=Andreprevotia lacus DSM 23236 TaxID=1121001 RepID=A0A1W1XYM0_9NEIS|nr:glycoside hydrolase family 99-like domain-containing protein [Andreprevotia lacus]SMC28964.1 Glycosyltransferase WbsX [Andreprevotia lacus DSM 23236]